MVKAEYIFGSWQGLELSSYSVAGFRPGRRGRSRNVEPYARSEEVYVKQQKMWAPSVMMTLSVKSATQIDIPCAHALMLNPDIVLPQPTFAWTF